MQILPPPACWGCSWFLTSGEIHSIGSAELPLASCENPSLFQVMEFLSCEHFWFCLQMLPIQKRQGLPVMGKTKFKSLFSDIRVFQTLPRPCVRQRFLSPHHSLPSMLRGTFQHLRNWDAPQSQWYTQVARSPHSHPRPSRRCRHGPQVCARGRASLNCNWRVAEIKVTRRKQHTTL